MPSTHRQEDTMASTLVFEQIAADLHESVVSTDSVRSYQIKRMPVYGWRIEVFATEALSGGRVRNPHRQIESATARTLTTAKAVAQTMENVAAVLDLVPSDETLAALAEYERNGAIDALARHFVDEDVQDVYDDARMLATVVYEAGWRPTASA